MCTVLGRHWPDHEQCSKVQPRPGPLWQAYQAQGMWAFWCGTLTDQVTTGTRVWEGDAGFLKIIFLAGYLPIVTFISTGYLTVRALVTIEEQQMNFSSCCKIMQFTTQSVYWAWILETPKYTMQTFSTSFYNLGQNYLRQIENTPVFSYCF